MNIEAVPSSRMFKLNAPRPPAGWWVLPGSSTEYDVRFHMPAKPIWLHRVCMRLLLGWKWVDNV